MTIEIPFTKLHGDENDFLLSWTEDVPETVELARAAQRICARNTGIGADGWMVAERTPDGLRTRLFNSDGSEAEISGNGTRCAAAFALLNGPAAAGWITISTGAGAKRLQALERSGHRFLFEMDTGRPELQELHARLELAGQVFDATILNVGNPQCALFVESMPPDWVRAAREAEAHPRFPRRSNVSLVRVIDRHNIDVLFYERGAGETRSSGTGSTGAAAAAILRGACETPVKIRTPAGSLSLRWDDSVYLTGPAEAIGAGRFYFEH